MADLYKRIADICEETGISVTTMCKEADVSRASLSDLKMGRKQRLSVSTLLKIANYFSLTADYFLGAPPFDCWELINQNRKGFLHYVDIPDSVLRSVWGIDPNAPESAPVKSFISFLDLVVADARPTEEGDWDITLQSDYTRRKQKEKPLVNDDAELTEYLEVLKTRPEMRMLFQLSKDATKEDVETAVRIIEALRNK